MDFNDFSWWMMVVNSVCERKYGISVYDLADCPFRDWFDDGVTPSAAASRARRAQD